jgi:flagellar FliL protein
MSATDTKTDADQATEKKGGGKKKLVMIVLLVAVLGGAGYWFFLKPSSGAAAPPKPGAVLALDPIQVNLADGHYLSIGIALQLTAGAGEETDGSKALDAELLKPKARTGLKKELKAELSELYDKEVMDVYLTQFVTQ